MERRTVFGNIIKVESEGERLIEINFAQLMISEFLKAKYIGGRIFT